MRGQLRWLREQMARAIRQLESTDKGEVLVGLQTLSMLNDASVRASARSSVVRLSCANDEDIARQATTTLASWKSDEV